MTSDTPTYSVVIPVFNAEDFLKETVESIIKFANSSDFSINEVILVDDGSSDNSWHKIKEICSEHEIVSGIKLRKNFGQHNATCAGILKSNGTFIITMDDDMEFDINALNNLIDNQVRTHSDVVYGAFHQDKGNLFIKSMRTFYAVSSRLVAGKNQVKGSSLRIMKSDLAKKIANQASNFVFIDEVVFWYTENIAFEKVTRIQGLRKKSNYTPRKLIGLGLDVVLYSSLIPLKVIKRIGLLLSVFMFFLGIFFILKYLIKGVGVEGFTALIVTIAFSTGFIIYTLGTIGEYIGKIFRNVNNAPVFSIEDEAE